ncbi:acyltransferase [uncultured Roseobacter sp.]|uniref:acyltransferase family protein n=1 Tax=uncultured Roseobacter sp. TaxID=114847 RepID=UPI002626681E|nr:acyltransferase [uncultured Roseobacter sp.]
MRETLSQDISEVSAPASHATSHAAYLERRRFSNLDGLRFICIFMVMWHHFTPFPYLEQWLGFKRGFLGVDFFFVLSGFLITTLLLREADATGRIALRDFYLRRILRIVPVYFFVVTCVSSYFIFVKGRYELLDLLPFYYLFLSNFLIDHIPLLTITWSLSMEEQYYLLWPLLVVLLPPRLLVPICIGLVAVNVVIISETFGPMETYVGPLRIALPAATYAPIILGSLAAVLLHKRRTFVVMNMIAGWPGAVLCCFTALGVLFHILPGDLRGLPNFAIHSTMTLCVIALVLREKNALSPFLQQRLVARVGAVSYGIYLYHLIALDVAHRILPVAILPKWAIFIVFVILAYLIAELSFRTLEAWFQQFRPKPRSAD